MNAPITTRAEFPAPLRFLFEPHRYKVLYGGRGSGKSWGIARALLILGKQHKLRVLCCREIQNSIDESVHALLSEQIEKLGLSYHYRVTKRAIIGANGTVFLYAGLWHNVDSIKSKEGFDIVWIEEAHTVSKGSWQKLIPTIRKDAQSGCPFPQSEIWVSFNPELEADEAFDRFVTHQSILGDQAVVKLVNWRDNPWFPSSLRDEMQRDRLRDYDDYLWTWEGHTRQFLNGSVYAKELRAAESEGRIREVPYDEATAVNISLDLGWRDLMTAWFTQKVGIEYRAVNYWQGRHVKVSEFWSFVRETGYNIGTVFLPHDAENGQLAADGGTVKQLFEKAGAPKVATMPRIPSEAFGIEKVRSVIPRVYFDREKCKDGLSSLRRYRYGIDEKTKEFSRVPVHDEASHGAKGFETFALSTGTNYTPVTIGLTPPPQRHPSGPPGKSSGNLGWLKR